MAEEFMLLKADLKASKHSLVREAFNNWINLSPPFSDEEMTPTQPRPALLLCHTGCLPQCAEQRLQLCPAEKGVAGQPGKTGHFLITVLWPRWDPLTRADAIPL